MKKVLIAALAILCLCGCNSGSDNSAASQVDIQSEVTVNAVDDGASASEQSTEGAALADVFGEIKASVELPSMVELNDNLLQRYYGLTTDSVSDYAGGVDSSGVGQDEIVLMKAADESQVETIQAALQTRYDSKLEQQENYNPDEAEKIRNCKVEVNGLYVTLIISNDAAQITEIVNGSLN